MKLKSIKIEINGEESIERTWEGLEVRGPDGGVELYDILNAAMQSIVNDLGG